MQAKLKENIGFNNGKDFYFPSFVKAFCLALFLQIIISDFLLIYLVFRASTTIEFKYTFPLVFDIILPELYPSLFEFKTNIIPVIHIIKIQLLHHVF